MHTEWKIGNQLWQPHLGDSGVFGDFLTLCETLYNNSDYLDFNDNY